MWTVYIYKNASHLYVLIDVCLQYWPTGWVDIWQLFILCHAMQCNLKTNSCKFSPIPHRTGTPSDFYPIWIHPFSLWLKQQFLTTLHVLLCPEPLRMFWPADTKLTGSCQKSEVGAQAVPSESREDMKAAQHLRTLPLITSIKFTSYHTRTSSAQDPHWLSTSHNLQRIQSETQDFF